MKKILLIVFPCLLSSRQIYSQETTPVVIPGSQVQTIVSHEVSGQEYELDILLPGGYQNSNKKYPVLYLMDSQWDFPLAKSLYGQHYFDGFIPEIIIVGVTWGGKNPNPDSLRARDYTPTKEARLPQSGGADKFLSCLRKEIFPYIDSKYKTDTGNRILMGCSLGGLFTMYTLFTHPDMFNSYIAASPAYGWDRQVLYRYEKKYFESNPVKPSRLYMTIGEVEKGVPGFQELTAFLAARNYPHLKIKSKILENTGHSGTKTEGFGRGMQFAFERPVIHPDPNVLKNYSGKYQLAQGGILEIKIENNGLVSYLGQNNKDQLFAADEKNYYATSEFFNIRFLTNNGRTEGLQLERYGRTDTARKIE